MTSIYLFKKIPGECGLLRILTKFLLVGVGGVEGFPDSFFMTFQVSEDYLSLSVLSSWAARECWLRDRNLKVKYVWILSFQFWDCLIFQIKKKKKKSGPHRIL